MAESETERKINGGAGRQGVDYGRLRNDLKGMLHQQYRGGDRVPSERRLAAEFQVSPATISRAMQDLALAGIVRRVRGSGTYLSENAVSSQDAMPRPALGLSGRTIGIVGRIGETPSRQGEHELVGHRISSAIEREIQSFGGRTRVIDAQRHAEGREQSLIAEMLRDRIDCLLLIDYSQLTTRWLPPMLEASRQPSVNLPLVLALTSGICEWPAVCARIDDLWGVFEGTSYLLSQGHRRLGFLSAPRGFYSWADARADAFSRAVTFWNSAHDVPVSGTVIYGPESLCSPELGCQWKQMGEALAEQFLGLDSLTGIIAANDNIALHSIAALKVRGIQVPRDVSVIGYDNIVEAASAELSTLDLPAEQLGIQAARLCRQSLNNSAQDSRMEVALRPILLIRSSIQPAD